MIHAKKNVGILKHLSKSLPLKTLDQMYKALVRSHLDYCDIIYHIPPILNQPPLGLSLNNLMEKIERIYYQADLAITGTWQGPNRTKLYEELGWESLSDRRMSRRILQIHKIIDSKTLEYLRVKLPPNRRLFLPTIFRKIKCRTYRYSNSFFPDVIASWNNMITHLKTYVFSHSSRSHAYLWHTRLDWSSLPFPIESKFKFFTQSQKTS